MTAAEQIKLEIEALRKNDLIDAKDIVSWARDNPESALHRQFEWDDGAAAAEYRLWQARRVIALYVVCEAGPRTVVSLTIDRQAGGGYRFVNDVLRNEDLCRVMLRDALNELRRTRSKYQHLQELASVYDAIDAADRQFSAGETRIAA